MRIALALKGLEYRQAAHNLRDGAQRDPAYLRLNPQGLVPALEVDGAVLTQSLAIIEYLDECFPEPPLLGGGAVERAHIRAFALAIACEIHPLQNLSVLNRIAEITGDPTASTAWAARVISEGLANCSRLIGNREGPYCFGARPSLADIVLIPQMANARRFGVAIVWDNLARIEAHCLSTPPFADTAPTTQPDATA